MRCKDPSLAGLATRRRRFERCSLQSTYNSKSRTRRISMQVLNLPSKGASLEGYENHSSTLCLLADTSTPILCSAPARATFPNSIRTNQSRFFKQLLDILASFPDILTCRSPLYYIPPSDNLSLYCIYSCTCFPVDHGGLKLANFALGF
jgi:hypothetical protein